MQHRLLPYKTIQYLNSIRLCPLRLEIVYDSPNLQGRQKIRANQLQTNIIAACEIWDSYLAKDCQMIESVQKFASRVCLKQWSRNTRYQDMLEFLNMPSLAARRRQRKLCTLVNNLSEYPSPPLILRNPYYPSHSVHCLSFVRPYAHTNQYFYSFFPHTVSLWNNLPYDVVSTVPFSSFKCRILDVCQSQPRAIHASLACIVLHGKNILEKKKKKLLNLC